VTLTPGKFYPSPPNFPQSDLGRRADSRWALPQISNIKFWFLSINLPAPESTDTVKPKSRVKVRDRVRVEVRVGVRVSIRVSVTVNLNKNICKKNLQVYNCV